LYFFTREHTAYHFSDHRALAKISLLNAGSCANATQQVDDIEDITKEYEISAMPTFAFIFNGGRLCECLLSTLQYAFTSLQKM
jgi:hypothetical protein